MPPQRAKKTEGDVATTGVRKHRDVSMREFSTTELHMRFERHIRSAQDAYLKGDNATAEQEATLALRIRPTPQLFALLSLIAESKGQFDRSHDFRLLQAFLARDAGLWEELLHDFLSQQLFYKSVVCLRRLSALETDPRRYRTLQLQLADLLIGLGEIRPATNVLVPLWNSSKCKDFEVFALLSSLYFQLGKWGSLEMLITSGLKNSFRATIPAAAAEAAQPSQAAAAAAGKEDEKDASAVKAEGSAGVCGDAKAARKAVSKRVRFYEAMEAEEEREAETTIDNSNGDGPTAATTDATSASVEDEFDFTELVAREGDAKTAATSLAAVATKGFASAVTTTAIASAAGARTSLSNGPQSPRVVQASEAVHQLYSSTAVDLATTTQKRNFLTLVNVHAEFLNERSRFHETVQLVEFTAAALQVAILELPPDVLVRLGTAYAFMEEDSARRMSWDVFQHLLDTCRMDEYGDVLLDAAVSLQSVSMHAEALVIFERFKAYYTFSIRSNAERLEQAKEREQEMLETAQMTEPKSGGAVSVNSRQVLEARQRVEELHAENEEMKTVMAAACFGAANSLFSLHKLPDAVAEAKRALEMDPLHLKARLLLGKIYFFYLHDVQAAIEVLTPRDGEPALHRIQLGATLVRVYHKSQRYLEAVTLGVAIFAIILTSSEDGDTESVAPGSSRRSAVGGALLVPTMSRASSAILPAASLAHSMALQGVGTVPGTNAGPMRRLSTSLAASIRAGTTVYRQQMGRVGRSALTTTIYGASAAASMASGQGREDEYALKDSATIFRFHRKRRTRATKRKRDGSVVAAAASGADNDDVHSSGNNQTKRVEESEDVKREEGSDAVDSGTEEGEDADTTNDEAEVERRRQERRDAVTKQDPKSFWALPGDTETTSLEDPGKRKTAAAALAKAEDEGEETSEAVADVSATDPTAPQVLRRKRGRGQKQARPNGGDESGDADAETEGRDGTRAPKAGAAPSQDNISNAGEREHDLNDLEAFEMAMMEGRLDARKDDAPPPESYELPSLEEISHRFNDPTVAKLFLEASSNQAGKLHADMGLAGLAGIDGGAGPVVSPVDALFQQNQQPLQAAGVNGVRDRVTLQEAVSALGHLEFMNLTVTIVDAYSMVGQFTEAKEFASLVLPRIAAKRHLMRRGPTLERPLRLAVLRAALTAREGEDAFRIGLRLLQDDQTAEERHEVIELMHGVLNLCEDRTSILYRVFLEGSCDVALLVLLGNRYHQTRSYTRVLNLYLAALEQRPSDIFLTFMVGLSYLLCSHQKNTKPREAAVSAGIYYLTQYQSLLMAVDPTRTGEALYNTARAMHFLKLFYLCVPLYERIARDLHVPSQCSLVVKRAAQTNLYFIHMWESENRRLALAALPRAGE